MKEYLLFRRISLCGVWAVVLMGLGVTWTELPKPVFELQILAVTSSKYSEIFKYPLRFFLVTSQNLLIQKFFEPLNFEISYIFEAEDFDNTRYG